jgi:hypothetical protein
VLGDAHRHQRVDQPAGRLGPKAGRHRQLRARSRRPGEQLGHPKRDGGQQPLALHEPGHGIEQALRSGARDRARHRQGRHAPVKAGVGQHRIAPAQPALHQPGDP